MKASNRKHASIPSRPPKRKRSDAAAIAEQINQILIFELDIEVDSDLKPEASLASFPSYDEEWTVAYLAALLEEEFTIEIADEAVAKLRTVGDVHNLIHRRLSK